MTLTILNAPFGSNPGSFNFERRGPAHVLYFEDSPRRVRVKLAGVIVADSRRMKLLRETGRIVVYYFHKDDIRGDLLVPSDHTSECPFKGTARYWSVHVSDRVAENVAGSIRGFLFVQSPNERFAPSIRCRDLIEGIQMQARNIESRIIHKIRQVRYHVIGLIRFGSQQFSDHLWLLHQKTR